MSFVHSSKITESNKNDLSNSRKKSRCGKVSSYNNTRSKPVTDQLEHKLINVVRMFPILYDEAYKSSIDDQKIKDKWCEVGGKMGVKGCKRKWLTLLKKYRKNSLPADCMQLMSFVDSCETTNRNETASLNSRETSNSFYTNHSKLETDVLERKLINVVKMFPMLYDVPYKSSKDDKKIKNKWCEVGGRMGVKGCEQKWLTLLEKYRKNSLPADYMQLMSFVDSCETTNRNKTASLNSRETSNSYYTKHSKLVREELERKLINVVKMFPMLYDVPYKSSNDDKKIELKWSEVGAKMGVKGCEHKWLTLLEKYRKNSLPADCMQLMSFVDSCETTNCNRNVLNSQNASEGINENLVDSPPSYVAENTPEELVSSKNLFQENINNTLQNVPSSSSSNSNSEAVFPCNNIHSEFVTYDSEEREEIDEVLSTTSAKNSNHISTLSVINKKSKIHQEKDEVPCKKQKFDECEDSFEKFLEYIFFTSKNFPPDVLNKLKLQIYSIVCATERVMIKKQQI